MFYGAGESGSIETTAMASLAFLTAGRNPETVREALTWLVAHKDGIGTWHSTQATVLALKALLAATGQPLGGDRPRRIAVTLDGQRVREIEVPADQADVVRQLDVSDLVTPGTHRLNLEDRGNADSGYQVVFRYHEPESRPTRDGGIPPAREPLTIRLDYDRTTLAVDDILTATATVVNRRPEAAPMVILDLPIPAGFVIEPDDLAAAVKAQTVAKYQVTPRAAIVYLRNLEPDRSLILRYRLRAAMPVKLTIPAARAYEYYDPSRQGMSPAFSLTVTAKGAR